MESEMLVAICTLGAPGAIEVHNQVIEQIVHCDSKARVKIFVNGTAIPSELASYDCVLEAQIGFASIRNVALNYRSQNESVVFLDDDSRIAKNWLQTILAAKRNNPHALIKGRVLYLDQRGFEAKHFRSMPKRNMKLKNAGAANLLIPSEILNNSLLYFNTEFNDGGEDTDFTLRCTKLGFKILYAPSVVAFEIVSPEKDREFNYKKRLSNSAFQYNRILKNNGYTWMILERKVILLMKILWSYLTKKRSENELYRNLFKDLIS